MTVMVMLFNATFNNISRGRRDHDRMMVGFITAYAISAYHHWYCEFESRSGRGVQHYVIKLPPRYKWNQHQTNNKQTNNISVISWNQFYWWWKPENLEKTTDLLQVTDQLNHMMLYIKNMKKNFIL